MHRRFQPNREGQKGKEPQLRHAPFAVPMAQLPSNFAPLIGTDETSIDDKGRIVVAKSKREKLGDSFVLVLGKAGGLCLYPSAVFEELFREIFSVDTMNPAREEYTRLMLSSASDDLAFDQQGRLTIPKRLREEARLTGDVLVLGCGDRLEIWARDEWVKFNFAPEKYNVERREAIESAYSRMLFSRRAQEASA